MSRRMSCSMTIEAVRNRTKTVTRRHVDTWRTLKPGDRLTLIEKGMGLKKGEHHVELVDVEIVDVDDVWLRDIDEEEVEREGFAGMSVDDFCTFWLKGHGYKENAGRTTDVECRRIEWRYLDTCPACGGDGVCRCTYCRIKERDSEVCGRGDEPGCDGTGLVPANGGES